MWREWVVYVLIKWVIVFLLFLVRGVIELFFVGLCKICEYWLRIILDVFLMYMCVCLLGSWIIIFMYLWLELKGISCRVVVFLWILLIGFMLRWLWVNRSKVVLVLDLMKVFCLLMLFLNVVELRVIDLRRRFLIGLLSILINLEVLMLLLVFLFVLLLLGFLVLLNWWVVLSVFVMICILFCVSVLVLLE